MSTEMIGLLVLLGLLSAGVLYVLVCRLSTPEPPIDPDDGWVDDRLDYIANENQ